MDKKYFVHACAVAVLIFCLFLYPETIMKLKFEFSKQYRLNNLYNISMNKGDLSSEFLILWYAKPDWIPEAVLENVSGHGCSFNNCILSTNIHLKSNANVLLFHHSHIENMPPTKENGQLWGFVTLEAPHHTLTNNIENAEWDDKFDFTFSYRYDSEAIFSYYGALVKKRNPTLQHDLSEIYKNKTKDVAWVVSNCNSPSQRMAYVHEMKKVIPVDIFGGCGEKCEPPSNEDCFSMISRKYKFYLSFENSLCTDYVTEKYYRLFSGDFNIVPVVRGAPNIHKILPPEVSIAAMNFSSPIDLANYLKTVSKNETMYFNLLKAKNRYEKANNNWYCDLCNKLNRKLIYNKTVDIFSWIDGEPCS